MALSLDEITQLEQDWIGRVAVSEPETYFDWQPASVDLFSQLLGACLPHVPVGMPGFLDVGCGIGTKCLLAQQAGFTAYGIDRVPEYLAEAAQLGVSAEQVLAGDYTGYSGFGLVYVNHPLNCGEGCDDEAVLEHTIHVAMSPGAVCAGMNYDLAPGCTAHPPDQPCTDACPGTLDGWTEIARLGPWVAAWVKQ